MFLKLLLLTIYIYIYVCFLISPFCYSTLLAPFCSFAISSSLSCTPFFLLVLSLVCFRSVKIPSFSLSCHHREPVASLLVTLLMFSFFLFSCSSSSSYSSSPSVCHFPLELDFLFSKNNGFKKTHHRNKSAHAPKFRWHPKTLLL